MIDIPPEVQIGAILRPGSVCYFSEPTFFSADRHFFVVINHEPLQDQVVVLIVASSKVAKVHHRTARFPGTLAEVTQTSMEVRLLKTWVRLEAMA